MTQAATPKDPLDDRIMTNLNLRIPASTAKRLLQRANLEGVKPQELVKGWVAEKLEN